MTANQFQIIRNAIAEAADYLAGYADADFDQGAFVPNTEMAIGHTLDEALAALERAVGKD